MVPPLRRVTFEKRESNQSASAPPLGTSPRLGVPSLRHCSVGPPRRAIHGPARLSRSYTHQICRSKACSRGGLTADLALPVVHPSDLWEQSLLAIAVAQSMKMLDVPASSRASSLPQRDSGCTRIWGLPQFQCGSGLAREGGVPVGEDVGCDGLFASKLAPTGFVACPFMQMIGAFRCVYECFSITHGIMRTVMNSIR